MGTDPAFDPDRGGARSAADAEDVAVYAEHGWYLSQKLFTDDELDDLQAATEKYYAGAARPRAAGAAAAAGLLDARATARCSGTTTTCTTRATTIGRILRKPLLGAVAARPGPGRRDPRVPGHADLQAADPGRAEQPRALALRQALLADLAPPSGC